MYLGFVTDPLLFKVRLTENNKIDIHFVHEKSYPIRNRLEVSLIYLSLYNNTCSFCIFIGRELCVIKVHTHG